MKAANRAQREPVEGREASREGAIGGKHGKRHELRDPVHETTMDSRAGEKPARDGDLRCCQRTFPVRNRMREIRTSGSVEDEGGNVLVYPATEIDSRSRRQLFTQESAI